MFCTIYDERGIRKILHILQADLLEQLFEWIGLRYSTLQI